MLENEKEGRRSAADQDKRSNAGVAHFPKHAHLGLASENTRFWIGGIASGKDDNCFGFPGLICCSLEHKASCVHFDNLVWVDLLFS